MTPLRKSNLERLKEVDYGLEEMKDGSLHLYSNKFLFVDSFNNHVDLAKWIEKNLK